MVQLLIDADITAPDTLRIREVTATGNGGWGSPNAARTSAVKFHITLNYPGSQPYTWETDGTAGSDFSLGKFSLTAAQLALYLADCANSGSKMLRSGCLRIKLEALTRETITRNYSNNFVTLTASLPAGYTFWVKRDGEWINVTSEGTLTNGAFAWQKLNTLYLYTNWEVRRGSVVADAGAVIRNQLNTTGTIQAGNLTVIGRGEVNVFIAIAERLAWSRRVLKTVTDALTELSPSYPAPGLPAFASSHSDDCLLAHIGSQLDILEGRNPLIKPDCQTGGVILKRIKYLL